MIRSKLLVSCAFAAILVLAAAPAWADSIPVTNASFESTGPLVPSFSGPVNLGPIPGWTTTGVAGSWQPTTIEFSSLPGPITIAYTNGGSISQDLGVSLAANTAYTLSVFVGDRLDSYGGGNYTISLDAGSTTLCTFSGDSSKIAKGTFVDETCTYQSGSVVPAGDLSILINGSSTGQVDVDNVSVVTPEPGSLALLTAGFGFLFFIARRRKLQLPVTA